ncbi:MAG: Ig-like domain-containing protein, partial [Methylobacter sp.]|uniref:tandem-95 repeat protein n=1 Tax=Methylobacter sp. TaxID=2051955 RepID=UPI00272F7740
MKHSPRSWSKARQKSSRSLRLVLEPRMVFDGSVANVIDAQAAADPAPDASSDASLPIEAQAAESQTLPETSPAFSLADAQTEALRLISEFLQQPDAQNQLFTLFGGQQDVASQEWLDTAQSLSQDIVDGRYTVRVETIGNAQIGGIFAAYSGQGPSGEATIFINRDWLDRSPSRETVSRVLIEELGHSLDHALNGSRDTAGDEGEAFAASVLHSDLSDADRARIAAEDDRSTVYLDGQIYEVEDAALTFSAVYKGTPSSWSQEAQQIQNVATVSGSNFKFTSLDPNAPYFSGNNVSGTLTYTDNLGASQSVDGVVSRLFKTGNTVEGLFFYAWGNTTTIGDGATDAAETSYILCIDPSKFTDGHSYYSTSSDPVDTKMNALIVPNSAPVANNDIATVSEDSSITGNVLTNDSDVNLDSLAVSAFTIAGSAGPFVTGTPYAISGVGSLTLNSNGSYTFTPAANYAGPVPLITYTVSDGSATSTATLSISITPVNDAPTGTDDSVTTTKDTPVILGISDFGSYSDVESSPLAKIQITTLETKGALQYYNGSSWVDVPLNQEITAADINAGKLRYTPASGESGASYTTIGFKVSDGSAYSAGAYTLTVNVNAGNAAPVANADTAPDAVEAGYNITGTNPAGNVLSNDSDADTAITAGTTHKVTLAGNAGANTSGAVASGTTSSSSPAGIAGLYGTLKIGADGSYIYEVDNNNATVQALRTTANTLTETFTYTMADASGATASSTLTVVIKGSNDAPVAVNDYDTLQETALSGGNYGSTSGNVLPNDTDVDAGDSKTVSGSYAIATGSSNGSVTVTFTGNGLASVSTGDYVYIDGATPQILTVNGIAITATKTASGITLSNQSALTQNDQGVTLVSGSILGFSGNNPPSGGYKTATINSTEAPSSTTIGVSNITNTISIGMSVTNGTDTRTVTGVTYDGSGNITQITVNTAVAWSAANLTFSAPASTTLTGRYGTLTLSSTGSYTYNLTSNALNDGQSFTEQFSYRLSDTGGATDDAVLYITVSGTTTTTLADDSVTVAEDSGTYIIGASNLLTNDTNATSITGFSWNGQTATAGNSITVSGIGVLTVNSNGTFSFNPEDNYTGTVPSVTYTATDGTYAASATLSISITPANDAPTATDDTVTTLEDTTVILALSDFGAYSDIENTALATIKITTLETSGSLEYNNGTSWVPVTQDQEISVADISAGKLRFVPAADANGSPYTTVGFKVSDGTDYSTGAYTLTLNVTPVNDAPINTVPGAQTLSDYQTLTFTSGLSVADIDDASLTVNLSVANGTLSTTLDNQNGTGGKSGGGTAGSPLVLTGTKAEINAMLASLVYTPDGGFSGADTLRMVTTDAGGLSDTDYVAITVNADNRALTVSSPTVNEASPYAVFSVSGATGQKVFLALDITGTGTGYAVSGSDFLPSLEYFNGTSWTAYTGAPVAIPVGGTVLLVRTPILQDTVNEGSETFKLTAANTAGVANATGGIATIRDDGQGDIYPDNTTGATDNGATKDDDRPLAVNNITVNEASAYAVFEVTGVAGQKVASLALVDGTAQGGSDYGTSFEYFNSGTGTWTAYSPSITLDGTGKLLVRTTINNDTVTPVYEGAETFGLVATNVGGRSFSGTAVILDDGTGDIYPNNTTGTKDPSPTGLDYDSAVSVTAFGPVNEGSTFAMFTVTGTAGVPLELSLNNRSTALELDSTQSNYAKIEYSDDGSNWTVYTWDGTEGNKPTAPGSPGNGTFYVRVTIASETDTIHEGAETFDLIATTIATGTTLTQSAYATSTIIDNGTGSKYDGTITSGTPTSNNSSLDNDTPTLTVSSPTVSEGDGYAVFTVSIDHASTTNISFTPSLSNVTATLATDTAAANTLEVSTNGGTSWSTVSGAVTIAAGQTSVQLRLAITDDTAIESSETFTLSTGTVTGTLTSSTAVIGTATITDNDSPSNHTPVAQNDTGSTAEDTTLTVSAANGLITSTLVSGGIDSDADVGDSLSITQFTVAGDATVYTAGQTATIAGKGSLTINSNGSYVFTPAANYNGSVPVATYTLSDGTATTTATLTLTVTAVNDVPLAKNNNYTATEDTLLTGKNIITDNDATAGADSDVETATASLTIAKVGGTAWASLTGGTDADHLAVDGWKQVSLTNGTLFIKQDGSTEYNPALNSTTGDSFTYTVSDGTGESASAATVTLNVTAVNDAPTSSDDSVTTNEDTAKLLALTDFGSYSDTENTAIASVKITTLESDGSLEYYNGTDWIAVTLNQEISAADIAANKLRFVPDANENGS